MNHPSEDQFLKLWLEVLDDGETRSVREHLQECSECRVRYERICAQTAALGSVRARIEPPAVPVKRTRVYRFSPLLKAAALLVVGFFGGLAAADLVRKPEIHVVPSYLIVSTPPDSVARCPVSDATAAHLP